MIIIIIANNHRALTPSCTVLPAMHVLALVTLTTTLDTLYCYSHFENKEVEGQVVK